MADLIASGHVVDLILTIMTLEFAFLLVRRKPGARSAAAVDLALALAPGACLALALRAALTGSGWRVIALWLALSFPIHVADLARRQNSA